MYQIFKNLTCEEIRLHLNNSDTKEEELFWGALLELKIMQTINNKL